MNVGGFFKTVGKVAYPMITIAAQAGGPFTAMAAQQVGKALGLDKAPEATPEAIEAAMQKATLDSASQLQLAKGEQDFQVSMETLTNGKIKNAQDFEAHLEEIAASDRDSARNRQIQIRDRTPQVAFYLLMFGFFIALGLLFKYPVPDSNKAAVFTMIGSLGTMLIMAATFYYGTTVGSARKTELLAQAPAVGTN